MASRLEDLDLPEGRPDRAGASRGAGATRGRPQAALGGQEPVRLLGDARQMRTWWRSCATAGGSRRWPRSPRRRASAPGATVRSSQWKATPTPDFVGWSLPPSHRSPPTALRPFMREVINGLVDKVDRSPGRCDLVADVCEPYPIPIICELLGAPGRLEAVLQPGDRHLPHLQRRLLNELRPSIERASSS